MIDPPENVPMQASVEEHSEVGLRQEDPSGYGDEEDYYGYHEDEEDEYHGEGNEQGQGQGQGQDYYYQEHQHESSMFIIAINQSFIHSQLSNPILISL